MIIIHNKNDGMKKMCEKFSIKMTRVVLGEGKFNTWIYQRIAFSWLWLQISMSGWLTGDYSLRCQPVEYEDDTRVLRVGFHNKKLLINIVEYMRTDST